MRASVSHEAKFRIRKLSPRLYIYSSWAPEAQVGCVSALRGRETEDLWPSRASNTGLSSFRNLRHCPQLVQDD
ncbi:hypothetical protein V5799_004649 [Amblyomma americanum]|uniref:Uncharacterized protein n=1 Tax=Amblyomma americanum TaxID=6943 RepID=A0AAQ4D5H9_AMBAM